MNMRKIWKQKINEIDKTILATSIGDDLRLSKLFTARAYLQIAFNRCGK